MTYKGEDFATLFAARGARATATKPLPVAPRLAAPPTLVSVPSEWLAGIASLEAGACPNGIGANRWAAFLIDCRALRDRGFLAQAARLGWSTRDLFGVHATHPAARYDCAGLAWLLDGAAPVLLTNDRCTLRNPHGAALTFYRRPMPISSVSAWALVAQSKRAMGA